MPSEEKRVGKEEREDWFWGVCCRLLTAYCRLFFGWGGLEAGQEVAGFWGLGLEVGFYVVDVDCGGWVGG